MGHLNARVELDDAEVVAGVEVTEDGLHGLTQLHDLAVHHGTRRVQHENHQLLQRRQVFWCEEMHEVSVVYLTRKFYVGMVLYRRLRRALKKNTYGRMGRENSDRSVFSLVRDSAACLHEAYYEKH